MVRYPAEGGPGVWLAAPRSVATHMLNALKLDINPFAGIKVEGVKAWKEDDERGFDPEQALTILSATVATPSHLISREMKAARRWVPWICAYTGARVNDHERWIAEFEARHKAWGPGKFRRCSPPARRRKLAC
jgi:hypothetical protein